MNQQLESPPDDPGTARAGTLAPNTVRLDDGILVATRPILPTDSAALQRFHSHLSAQSIYLRFFQCVPVLTPERADYFSHLDGVDRAALVALDPANPSEIIGVARYDRDAGTDGAEYAIVVADRWQGRGLGLGLTRQLVAAARAQGIRHFYAYVLLENRRMLNLFHDLALLQHGVSEDGVRRIDLDLFHQEHAGA